jgi:hypothetical protein
MNRTNYISKLVPIKKRGMMSSELVGILSYTRRTVGTNERDYLSSLRILNYKKMRVLKHVDLLPLDRHSFEDNKMSLSVDLNGNLIFKLFHKFGQIYFNLTKPDSINGRSPIIPQPFPKFNSSYKRIKTISNWNKRTSIHYSWENDDIESIVVYDTDEEGKLRNVVYRTDPLVILAKNRKIFWSHLIFDNHLLVLANDGIFLIDTNEQETAFFKYDKTSFGNINIFKFKCPDSQVSKFSLNMEDMTIQYYCYNQKLYFKINITNMIAWMYIRDPELAFEIQKKEQEVLDKFGRLIKPEQKEEENEMVEPADSNAHLRKHCICCIPRKDDMSLIGGFRGFVNGMSL